MELEVKKGVKVVLPEVHGKTDAVLFGCGLEGSDHAIAYVAGNSLGVMILIDKLVDQIMRGVDGEQKGRFVAMLAETMGKHAQDAKGVDIVLVKRDVKVDSDD